MKLIKRQNKIQLRMTNALLCKHVSSKHILDNSILGILLKCNENCPEDTTFKIIKELNFKTDNILISEIAINKYVKIIGVNNNIASIIIRITKHNRFDRLRRGLFSLTLSEFGGELRYWKTLVNELDNKVKQDKDNNWKHLILEESTIKYFNKKVEIYYKYTDEQELLLGFNLSKTYNYIDDTINKYKIQRELFINRLIVKLQKKISYDFLKIVRHVKEDMYNYYGYMNRDIQTYKLLIVFIFEVISNYSDYLGLNTMVKNLLTNRKKIKSNIEKDSIKEIKMTIEDKMYLLDFENYTTSFKELCLRLYNNSDNMYETNGKFIWTNNILIDLTNIKDDKLKIFIYKQNLKELQLIDNLGQSIDANKMLTKMMIMETEKMSIHNVSMYSNIININIPNNKNNGIIPDHMIEINRQYC